MGLSDEIAVELDRLEVDGWQRTIALDLADSVEQRGTVSAAALLRTHMIELAREYDDGPAETSAVDAIRATMRASHPAMARGRNKRESIPRKSPGANKSVPAVNKSRACVDCGAKLPAHTGRGRPRVRCAGGCTPNLKEK
ncbi:hypothetical protein [Microbacterium sp.]|uniref:hypothetical protein n=1 Tax=Microbacterium sp. TaxID=51671 RepID=UPI003C725902